MDNSLDGSLVLLVDDTDYVLELLEAIFADENAQTIIAADGFEGLKLFKEYGSKIDLVITDVNMPVMNGIEFTRKARDFEKWRHVPIVILTAEKSTEELLTTGLEAGANDYLNKPLNRVQLIARSKSMVRQKRLAEVNIEFQKHLELMVVERTVELEQTRDLAMFGFAKLAEYRDPETGGHLERIREYTLELAKILNKSGPYAGIVDEKFMRDIVKASPLHDIGKVGVRDNILLKPGSLTSDEFEVMKKHTQVGGETLESSERKLGTDGSSFLTMAKEIAHFHHEKWDGSGYPNGRAGKDIPLAARIMAISDVYDALVSKRTYKDAWSHEKAHNIILESRETHFDPAVVEAYIEAAELFKKIKDRLIKDRFRD